MIKKILQPLGVRRRRRGQLELGIGRDFEPDRNFEKGGRSFYFFDFDDNVAVLSTQIYLFHKETNAELPLSSRQFAEQSRFIGESGPYKDYHIDFDQEHGSFRDFRDRGMSLFSRLVGRKEIFVQDIASALGYPEFHWKGPSWHCFYHAVFNRRPVSLITARGHDPVTIKQGIRLLINHGHLPHEPNYLSLYPVNHPEIKNRLSEGRPKRVSELKQSAIRASVEQAIERYGFNPHHRFGMSDDDPENIELIIEEMARLKQDFPPFSFFVIDTHKGRFVKREVFSDHTEDQELTQPQQLKLF